MRKGMTLVWAVIMLLGSFVFLGVMNAVSSRMRSDIEMIWRLSEGRKKVCALNILGLGVHRVQEGGVDLGEVTDEASEVWNGFVAYVLGTSNLGIPDDPSEATDLSSAIADVDEFCEGVCKWGEREWQLYMFKTDSGNYYLVSRVRCSGDRRWTVAWAKGRGTSTDSGGGSGSDGFEDVDWSDHDYELSFGFNGDELIVRDPLKVIGEVSAASGVIVTSKGVLWVTGSLSTGRFRMNSGTKARVDGTLSVNSGLFMTARSYLVVGGAAMISGNNLELHNRSTFIVMGSLSLSGNELILYNKSNLFVNGGFFFSGEELRLYNRSQLIVKGFFMINARKLRLYNESRICVDGVLRGNVSKIYVAKDASLEYTIMCTGNICGEANHVESCPVGIGGGGSEETVEWERVG